MVRTEEDLAGSQNLISPLVEPEMIWLMLFGIDTLTIQPLCSENVATGLHNMHKQVNELYYWIFMLFKRTQTWSSFFCQIDEQIRPHIQQQ